MAAHLFRHLRPDGGLAVLARQKSGIDAGTNSKYIIAAIRPFPHRQAGEGTCPLPAVTVRQPPHPDTCRPRHALMYAFPDRPLLPVLSPASSASNGLRKAVIHLTAQTGHTTSRTVWNEMASSVRAMSWQLTDNGKQEAMPARQNP